LTNNFHINFDAIWDKTHRFMLEYELEQEREKKNGEMLPTILVGGGACHGGEEVSQSVGEEWQWRPAIAAWSSGGGVDGGGTSRRWQFPLSDWIRVCRWRV
jgi:hypothetical protein